MKSRRFYLLIGLVLILIIALALFASHSSRNQKPGGAVPADVSSLASQYLGAEENSIGADQSSPTSWLNQVKSIVTNSWLAKLQPSITTTSSVPAQYYIAHNNKYLVKTTVSNCIWITAPTNTQSGSAVVFCSLIDKTVDQQTGSEIPTSNLPFGWTHSGQQAQHNLYLVKQNGHWLIDNVLVLGS